MPDRYHWACLVLIMLHDDCSGSHAPCCRRSGRWNAVMFWYKLHLFGDVYLSTGPEAVAEGGLGLFVWVRGWLACVFVACFLSPDTHDCVYSRGLRRRQTVHTGALLTPQLLLPVPPGQQACSLREQTSHAAQSPTAATCASCANHARTLPPPCDTRPAAQACAACSPRCSTLLESWRCMRVMSCHS